MRRANGGPTITNAKRCICGKKKSTKAQAKKEAKFLKYHKKFSNMIPQAYQCKMSGSWHVGNS